MTDEDKNTPSEEHDHSITLKKDFDDYGLHQHEDGTTIIRIDHDTHIFERIGTIESVSSGVVLKEHTRLTDDIANDITEAYTPTQFISARTDEFESRLQDAIFEFVYADKILEGLAEELSAELAEAMSGQYTDNSLYD